MQGHRIPARVLDEVFSGPVDAAVIDILRAGQHSRRLLLLKVLRDQAIPDEVWETLVDAERRAPDVVRDVLAYPPVGAWLVRVVRKLRDVIDDDVPVATDLGYLNSIAAAAALRAGVTAIVDVPVLHGRVSLPTIGQYEVPGGDGTSVVRLRVADSAAFLETGADTWLPVDELPSYPLREHRSTRAGQSVSWTIDDIDPYRIFDAPQAPRRLDAAEYADWCGQLDEAWAILVAEQPDHVPEVSATGPFIVPIPPRGGLIATTSATAFGAICLTPPTSAAELAETVVHELQHSKLNALLDLVTLQEPGSNRLCYAPWRRDPRPLSGLLHGIYAFTGVAEYWRGRWRTSQDLNAVFMVAHHREQVRAALAWLGPAPELTEHGDRFLEVSAARLAACEVDAPDDVLTAVALLSAENRLAWRLRHLVPREEQVALLARRWLAGAPPPDDVTTSEVRPDHHPDVRSGLRALLTMRAVEPARFAAAPGPAAPGELALARGANAEAVAAYADRLRANADDDAAWAGLLLAAGAGELPSETVSAACHRIRAVSGTLPDPVRLVAWFAGR